MEQVQKLKELATKTTSTLKDVVVDGGTVDNNGFANTVNSWLMIEHSIEGEVFKLHMLRDDIMQRLDNMRVEHSRLALLLELRYINCLTWREVVKRMNYSKDRVFVLRREALKVFENYMDI